MTLSDIREGGDFVIAELRARGEIRRRLVDMGFVRGAQGRVLRQALLRDPIELFIQGYRVSLRRSEALQILVEDMNESNQGTE
jgi:Fe2+ transport system protein FeoA